LVFHDSSPVGCASGSIMGINCLWRKTLQRPAQKAVALRAR
jgi:hypothetical protein